jgi:hypothetical protein
MSHIKTGWAGTGKVRMGKGTELKRTGNTVQKEHPEKNPQLGTQKPFSGIFGTKKK